MHQRLVQEFGLPCFELLGQAFAGGGNIELGAFGQQRSFKNCCDCLRNKTARIFVETLRSLEHHGQTLA